MALKEELETVIYTDSRSFLVSQAARTKKPSPCRGTIPFWLYIVPTDLVSVFLYVGNLQITYGDLPTRFSSFFL